MHSEPWQQISPVRAQIEALLLVADSPWQASDFAQVLEYETAKVQEVLEEIATEYEQRSSGMRLRHTAQGWRWHTAAEQAGTIERFGLDGAQTKLSRAALETLAVVAYRQPATRAQVAAVRGVNVDGVMRTLNLRGLIREVGTDPTTGAHLYETTELFLELLGIESLDALPNLAPLLPDIENIEEY